MSTAEFRLVHRNIPRTVGTGVDLKSALDKIATAPIDAVALELWEGTPPSESDRVFDWFVGRKPATTCQVLTVHWSGDRAHVTFEKGAEDWIAHDSHYSGPDDSVDFRKQSSNLWFSAPAWFSAPSSACIPKPEGFQLLEEFFQSRRRPADGNWRRQVKV